MRAHDCKPPDCETNIMVLYNCSNCPGYCCSYPVIPLTKRDVERLARHHGLSYKDAKAKFTKEAHGHKYTMRRKRDEIYGRICRFFDTTERRCTIYHARPATCRSYPGQGRCGYYDFLMHERRCQRDDEFVAVTNHDAD
jgi:Fe-S-cluster containining protein